MTSEAHRVFHSPVLVNEMLQALRPVDGGQYLDGTFGAGGYARALLDAANCRVWAIDRDPDAIKKAKPILRQYSRRLTLIEGRFGDMVKILDNHNIKRIDGITLDLGVSSMQLDDSTRGFSFQADGPLDMRQSSKGRSAAEIVNEEKETVLADIIYRYGEERKARKIARAIVERRRKTPITRTSELADIVRGVFKGRYSKKIDPATRTFQAVRIETNNELIELKRGLAAAEILLAPGGRLAVVSFHSLEDRIVKQFLRERSGLIPEQSRHYPREHENLSPVAFKLITGRAIKPDEIEIQRNPRARSARLRCAERARFNRVCGQQ